MEYFLGSVISLMLMLAIQVFYKKYNKTVSSFRVVQSQSILFEMIKPVYLTLMSNMPVNYNRPNTQSYKHYSQSHFKVMFIEDKAYWIKDNAFYVANVVDGFIDPESTETVDIMGMDKVQLDKMMFIVETLTEGTNANDNWSTGDK